MISNDADMHTGKLVCMLRIERVEWMKICRYLKETEKNLARCLEMYLGWFVGPIPKQEQSIGTWEIRNHLEHKLRADDEINKDYESKRNAMIAKSVRKHRSLL